VSRTSSRRRRGSEHSSGHSGGSSERWLVSYADLITLLFAFFVVLYAISQSDIKKFREVSEAMRRAFSANSTSSKPLDRSEPDSFGAPGLLKTPAAFLSAAGQGMSNVDPELEQIRRLLEEVAELDSSVAKVEVLPSGEIRWVVLDSFPERVSQAGEDFWPLLRRVARVLARFPDRRIRWEGHVDPGEASEDPHSPALVSMSRAEWMDQFMSREWKVMGGTAMRRRSAEIAGFGASRPIRLDTSRWSRARNRRVELVILPRSRTAAEN
jgi:chemotaxis protein MotB